MTTTTKTCSVCEVSKPLEEFHYVALGVTTKGCVVCVQKPVNVKR
jgi:ribosomal protein S8E